jgi:hypothetical protein
MAKETTEGQETRTPVMSVQQTVTRRDTVILIGPLEELYERAGIVVTRYLGMNWTLERSTTEPNAGPRMQLQFIKERAEENAG